MFVENFITPGPEKIVKLNPPKNFATLYGLPFLEGYTVYTDHEPHTYIRTILGFVIDTGTSEIHFIVPQEPGYLNTATYRFNKGRVKLHYRIRKPQSLQLSLV